MVSEQSFSSKKKSNRPKSSVEWGGGFSQGTFSTTATKKEKSEHKKTVSWASPKNVKFYDTEQYSRLRKK